MNLIATANFPYAGRRISKGDKFSASRKDARILKALKKARCDNGDEPIVDQPPQPIIEPPLPTAGDEDLGAETDSEEPKNPDSDACTAEAVAGDEDATSPEEKPEVPAPDAAAADISPRTGKPKRQYNRRDLTAEG